MLLFKIIEAVLLSTLLVFACAVKLEEQEKNVTCNAIVTEASRYPPDHAVAAPCCHGNRVQYSCINGHRRVSGEAVRVCVDGTLRGEQPVCKFPKAFTCGNPGPVMNGYFVGSRYAIGDHVTYNCYPGFGMRGHPSRECLPSGMWSEPPECVLVEELQLEVDNAAEVVSGNLLHRLYEPSCAEPGHHCETPPLSRKRRSLQAHSSDGLDLVFLFDASRAINKEKFKVGLRFAQELIRILDATLGRGQLRVGSVTFGTKVEINFNMSPAGQRTIRKLWSIKKSGGCGGELGDALDNIITTIVPRMRPSSNKALFIVTNGKSIIGSSHKKSATTLKNEKDFDIYAIAVGKGPNKEELQSLVSQPIRDHVITLKHIGDVFTGVRKVITTPENEFAQCGISDTKSKKRTVRGNKAASGVWPWQIGIFWDRGRLPICGGALIGEQWILTTAHCFYSSARKPITWPPWRYTIVAGDHKTNSRESFKQMVPVAKIYVHSGYKYRTHENDIAVVKLQYKFKLNKYIRPVCLPKASRVDPNPAGKRGFVAAWDRPSEKHRPSFSRRKSRSRVIIHTALVISSGAQCRNSTKIPFNSSLMFCANDGKDYKQTCRGDGGSPFISESYDRKSRGYRWAVNGLVSWDEQCGSADHVSFFTRVGPYVDWIRSVMSETKSRRRRV